MRAWADKWANGMCPEAAKEFNEALERHDAGHKEAAEALQAGKVDGLAIASAGVMSAATKLWQAGEDDAARTLRGAAQTIATKAEEERRKL